jgi:hypothetical protein
MTMSLDADSDTSVPGARHILAQMTGMLVPPIATLAGMQVAYAIVDRTCRSGGHDLTGVHIVRLVTLLVIWAAGLVAWREWRSVGVEQPGDGGSVAARTRFSAWLGVFAAGLFSLVVIAQWLATLILAPCQ